MSDNFDLCLLCGTVSPRENICLACSATLEHAWCVDERRDVLKRILDDYKFHRVYDAHRTIANFLAQRTPSLPADCVVVPIPTVASHIRQRGYDHMLAIARQFAKEKGLKVDPFLKRKTTTIQTGRTRKERYQQAKSAFALKKTELQGTYLLIDDVVTTGATILAAASLLRQHGATEVWAAVLVRQPLD